MKTFTKLFASAILFVLLAGHIYSQDIPSGEDISKLSIEKIGVINHTSVNGTIFKTINLNTNRDPLGVTVVNSQIIVSSTDNNGSNYFDVYDISGNYISSTLQGTTSQYGYRDLAFDGTYILASDDSTIKKIDPNTFQVVSQISNGGNSPHRGLAYDPNENVIYSSNWKHNILKINPATGATIKTLNKPTQNVYGLAIDYFSNPNYASLCFAEPTSYTAFRLSRADTSFTRINFTYDLTAATPDSALSGGLEIINNYPGYADSVIALIIDQHNKALYLVNITGAPQTFPASLELVGEFQGANATGIITSGMVQYDNYLYSVDNQKLAIYEITTNPALPTLVKSVTVPNGNRIFLEGNFGNNIIVTTKNAGQYGFAAFSLADPLNPQLESWTGTTNPIIAMDVGSYSFILEEGLNKLLVYYTGNFTNPVLNGSYNLQGVGVCLAKDPDKNLLFVGTKGNGIENGIQVFDYSNPNTLVEKYHKSFIGNYPQRIVVLPSENKIILGSNSTSGTSSLFYSYDYSDPTNLVFKNLQYISFTKGMWDMRLVDNMITVTLPEDGKFLTYKWDDASNFFLMGPSADLTEPIDIISYLPVSPPQNIKEYNSTFGGTPQDRYFYIPNGYASGPIVAGSEKTSIIKTKQPPPPTAVKVNLTMNINPPEATAFSVSTIPASGAHEYNIGEVVNLTAIPNEAVGWYFTGWTGDASGTNANTNITMDIDKNVTANFDLLELTVSGYVGSDTFFPTKDATLQLPFAVCATDVDGWVLQKISFRASGTLDDANDVYGIQLLRGSNEVFDELGGYSSDNGTVDITFTPPIIIGPGECVNFIFNNFLKINDWNYENEYFHDIKSFHVESFGVTAVPQNFTGGIIAGKAKNDSTYFTQIRNSEYIPFHTINAAIESPLTLSNDIITVDDGWYSENIKLDDPDKPLTVISHFGPDSTFIMPVTSEPGDFAFVNIKGNNKKLVGFTLDTGDDIYNASPSSRSIAIEEANYCEIKNNIFKGNGLIDTYNAYHNKYLNNVTKGKYRNFRDDFVNSQLFINIRGDFNLVSNNKSSDSTNRFSDEILLELSSSNNIIKNNENMSIRLIAGSTNNTVKDNINAEYIGLKDGRNNEVLNNTTNQIELNDEYNSRFIGNDVEVGYSGPGFLIHQSGIGLPTHIDFNKIHGDDATIGILAEGGGYLFIEDNEIINHRQAIWIRDMTRVVIRNNRITPDINFFEIITGNGIIIWSSHNVTIEFNRFQNALRGIEINGSGKVFIWNNFFDVWNAITMIGSDVSIAHNNFFQGFHDVSKKNNVSDKRLSNISSIIKLNNSSPLIFGNNITKGNGNGIYSENNSLPVITNNNIYGNGAFQIENSDPNVTFSADNNFWGSPAGPAPQDVSGNININSWLSEEVSLLALPAIDTTLSKINTSDSVSFFIQNLKTLDDIVNVTVNDDKGWVTSINNLQLQLQDTTGYELPVKYNVSANAQINEISTVNYSVTSTSDSNTVSGVFYINTYAQNLTALLINSDSLTTGFGQSAQFNAVGFDQYVNPVSVTPLWSTNKGTISQTGLLVSDSTAGEGIITLTDQTSGLKSYAHFYNSDQAAVLTNIKINPDSLILNSFNGFLFRAKGYNQFNYPKDFVQVWNSSGGTIDNIGFFTPDSVTPQYIVTVSDTSNSFIDSAVVIMQGITGVEDEVIIPQKYSLSQNYPNPFNPATTIRFTLVEPSFVKLEVFNILGQRVMTPVDSYLNAGTYNKVLNFNRYASGVYFYRLIAKGKFIDVKKLLLLK